MISLTFIEAVPVIEVHGRAKNLVNRITNEDLAVGGGVLGYCLEALPNGWLITHPVSAKSKIPFPDTFVPHANIRAVEGHESELRSAYDTAKRAKAA